MTSLINGALPPLKQIRFVNNQGQPPSKRRRINAACLTCRKRKTRCAGEKPVCSTCSKNGHDCLGYSDLVEKKKDGVNGFLALKSERGDATDSNHDPESEYLEDEEEDERRHWKSKTPAIRTAGFVTNVSSRHDSAASVTPPSARPRKRSNDWGSEVKPHNPDNSNARGNGHYGPSSYSEDGRSSNNRSPVQRHTESHRVPYFRYFGPTAIVPGFKQMVVHVPIHRDRRRSRGSSFSTTSPGSLFGIAHSRLSHPKTVLETLEDLPVYDVNDPRPVDELIVTLVKTFFLHLGCNYRFLNEERTVRLVQEKRIEPILVDSMCALAARFSDLPVFTNEHHGRVTRFEYGHIFAQRAKAATVDSFPCPSVAAVQAYLLMAYEGFGENQDSALWMYLGLSIRMALDLGLQKMVGIQYQGERDPWYTRVWNRKSDDGADASGNNQDGEETLSPEEQHEVEQERMHTFWAVFILDRVISSGTGRPVTFRDDDYELALPAPTKNPVTGWADPLPAFIEIIHLYGRVSDVLNRVRDANDLTEEKMAKLAQMESDLTQIYQKQDENLHFNAVNFREYVKAGHGTTFILLHFWFHALIIVLHQPTLLAPFGGWGRVKLLPNSRELSMSSAKTIADILAFAELIDPKSFIGNPFTSQPMYIAACAFLMESAASPPEPSSREDTPVDTKVEAKTPGGRSTSAGEARPSKHSLLAAAANQNFERCYKSLQQLQQYWGGVGYILTALDQKSKGIWDCETFTNEEYPIRRGSLGRRLAHFENPASPNVPPIAWSLTGTTNSPNSNLTLLYQNNHPTPSAPLAPPPLPPPPSASHSHSVPVSAPTPPGNMIYDPIRQIETSSMFPPAYPQPNVSAVRNQAHPSKANRASNSSKSHLKYEVASPDQMDASSPNDKMYVYGNMPQSGNDGQHQRGSFTPSSQHQSTSDGSVVHSGSPSSTFTDSGSGQQHSSHFHQNHTNGASHHHSSNGHNPYESDFPQHGMGISPYPIFGGGAINETITLDSRDIDIDALGLSNEMGAAPWLEFFQGDFMGMFEHGLPGGHHG
ncbi:hypothetical protein OQA88_11467 [Cercophora sp. LCS_1]